MGLLDSIRSFFLRRSAATLPPEDVANAILSGISGRPDAERLSQALQVRLANRAPISMYGEQIVDTLNDANPNQRLSYDLQPFAHMSQGASSVVIAQDAMGENYILLGERKDGTGWGLPAGYASVAPSANKLGVFSADIGHTRDDFERALLDEGKRVADKPVNSLVAAPPSHDKTLVDTAIRETFEETGLKLRPDQLQFVALKEVDRSGDAQNPHQHESHYYLVDLRADKTLPPVEEHDDLANPQWVKLSELKYNGESLQLRGIPVTESEGIEQAITKMRENEYASFGVTKEAIADFSHLPTPTSVIGKEADDWHKNALSIAAVMKEKLQTSSRNNRPTTEYGLSV